MEKVTWRAVIKEGMVKEYIKRHDEIWPETVSYTHLKQKVNDEEGNPIEIGVVVIWKITNTARAVFCVCLLYTSRCG